MPGRPRVSSVSGAGQGRLRGPRATGASLRRSGRTRTGPDRLTPGKGLGASVFAGSRPTRRRRPHPREPRYGAGSRGPALRLLPTQLHGVVRPEHGAEQCLHRYLGLCPWLGALARPGGHLDRRDSRSVARGPPRDMGSKDRHGTAALGSAALRQEHLDPGSRPMVEHHRLGRARRAVRRRGSPAALPRPLHVGRGPRPRPRGVGWVPRLRIHPSAREMGQRPLDRTLPRSIGADLPARQHSSARHGARCSSRRRVRADDDDRLQRQLQLGQLCR